MKENRISLRGTSSTTNPTVSAMGLNPGFRYQKSTTYTLKEKTTAG